MDENSILMSHIMLKLPDRLQKRLALNITCCPSHFNNGDPLLTRCFGPVKASLDLIGDMRDHLHRPAAVIPMAFFVQNGPVNFTCGHIGVFIQTLIYKSLVMPQVQICFCPVICHEYLSMLDWIHGSGVYVDIRVKFLHRHLITSGF